MSRTVVNLSPNSTSQTMTVESPEPEIRISFGGLPAPFGVMRAHRTDLTKSEWPR